MTKMIRIAAALLTSVLALGAYTVGFAPSGTAVSPSDGDVDVAATETYKSQKTGECLDDFGGTLDIHDCDGSREQKWTVRGTGGGTVQLKNGLTGDCISDSGGTLGTGNCSSSDYQRFSVTHWEDGTLRFRNVGSGQCIKAASGHEVGSSTTCDKSEAESWS